MKVIIITNNPLVQELYQDNILIIKNSFEEVLWKSRDLIHSGHKLLTHPLTGSIKPNETPYRSIMVTDIAEKLDYKSLSLIESAIQKYQQFQKDRVTPNWPEKILKDFQMIDLSLFKSGYDSMINI